MQASISHVRFTALCLSGFSLAPCMPGYELHINLNVIHHDHNRASVNFPDFSIIFHLGSGNKRDYGEMM